MISLIAAVARNGIIGSNNSLPWRLRDDLRRFKTITSGHTVLMGRKTFESIGRPLPNRTNLVLTRRTDEIDGVELIHSLDALQEHDDVFVIGGAEVYAQTINDADMLYITEVAADVAGDARFPGIEPSLWREVSREHHSADDENQYDVDYVVYQRR